MLSAADESVKLSLRFRPLVNVYLEFSLRRIEPESSQRYCSPAWVLTQKPIIFLRTAALMLLAIAAKKIIAADL